MPHWYWVVSSGLVSGDWSRCCCWEIGMGFGGSVLGAFGFFSLSIGAVAGVFAALLVVLCKSFRGKNSALYI